MLKKSGLWKNRRKIMSSLDKPNSELCQYCLEAMPCPIHSEIANRVLIEKLNLDIKPEMLHIKLTQKETR
jgi:hypothetical protein